MTLHFKPVTPENFHSVIALTDTLSDVQKQCVASNLYSIAEASLYPNNAYHRAIYDGETLVGFFMMFIPDAISIAKGEDDFFLWRFMIGGAHQGKGYARQALDQLRMFGREKGFDTMLLSCTDRPDGPYPFYKHYGFVRNGKMYDDEVGMVIDLPF